MTGNPLDTLLAQAEQAQNLSSENLDAIEKEVAGDASIIVPEAATVDKEEDEKSSADLRTQIGKMNIPEKIKAAMFGNAVCRKILIFDPNRLITHFVLKNPKLALNEVEEFVKSTTVSKDVLRAVSDSQKWMKSYSIKVAIVINPKTPGDIALKWMRYLNGPELKKISKSKNVPQLVATTAKKRLEEIEKG